VDSFDGSAGELEAEARGAGAWLGGSGGREAAAFVGDQQDGVATGGQILPQRPACLRHHAVDGRLQLADELAEVLPGGRVADLLDLEAQGCDRRALPVCEPRRPGAA
jgi:hypothetical protein